MNLYQRLQTKLKLKVEKHYKRLFGWTLKHHFLDALDIYGSTEEMEKIEDEPGGQVGCES